MLVHLCISMVLYTHNKKGVVAATCNHEEGRKEGLCFHHLLIDQSIHLVPSVFSLLILHTLGLRATLSTYIHTYIHNIQVTHHQRWSPVHNHHHHLTLPIYLPKNHHHHHQGLRQRRPRKALYPTLLSYHHLLSLLHLTYVYIHTHIHTYIYT